jgi:ferrochelatase
VLYDLDIEAAQLAVNLGLPLARAATVGTHSDYIDALASSVSDAWQSARSSR